MTKAEQAKARRHYMKEHEPEKYDEYLRQCREKRKRDYDNTSVEDRRDRWRKNRKSEAGHYQRYERNAWRRIIERMKLRAREKGIPFDDTINIDFMVSICPTHCPILGIELKRAGRDTNRQSSPSVDRLDPRAGYTRSNIIVVSNLANTIRNAATTDQIIAVGQFYKKLLKELGIDETNQ